MPHLRTYPSLITFVALPNISSGCFDQPSFGLWARRASSAPRWWVVIGWFRSISSGLVSMRPHTANGWFRSTSSNTASMRPLHYNDVFWYIPQVHTAFTVPIFQKPLYKPSFGLRVTMIWYAPPIAYRLVANSHFEVFFCALEAVVLTLVQMDSINNVWPLS